MNIKNLNSSVKDIYINQAFEILNFFKSMIIEVHHIGSSKLRKFPYDCDLDILFIVKSYDDVKNLADILIAEGYVQIDDFSDFFRDDMVIRRTVDGTNINMIFMSSGSRKKETVINCTEFLVFDKNYSDNLKLLKKAFLKSEITEDEYGERKYRLFSMMNRNESSEGV